MKPLRVLFLGASRLVGLLDRFLQSAAAEEVEVELFSVEDTSPYHSIAAAGICRVIPGPRFFDEGFADFLLGQVRERSVDVVIPAIDGATVALSLLREQLEAHGVLALVSQVDLCQAMRDKSAANDRFQKLNLPIPGTSGWPLLAKPRCGSSSRGHFLLHDPEEYVFWARRNRVEDYVVQDFLDGTEYSVDAFVDRAGRLLGAVSRIRRQVSGGEVMITETHREEHVLNVAERAAAIPGWYGPLNIQIMDSPRGPFLLEVNPRFSSGVTCAIEAGLDVPRWIIRERLCRPLPDRPIDWKSGLCMTRSRKDHFLWLS